MPDWSGGTRLGEQLRAFLVRWGRRGCARGAVVVICSDGWERGDPALLAEQMAQLSPAGAPGDLGQPAPRAAGLRAAARPGWRRPCRTSTPSSRVTASRRSSSWPDCSAGRERAVRDVIEDVLRLWDEGRPFGLATVVRTWRSAPRPAGASMAVSAEGEAVGSVSGGCVEGAVYDLAQHVVEDGEAVVQRYGVSDDEAFAVGLTCGGIMDILVEPSTGSGSRSSDRSAQSVARRRAGGRRHRRRSAEGRPPGRSAARRLAGPQLRDAGQRAARRRGRRRRPRPAGRRPHRRAPAAGPTVSAGSTTWRVLVESMAPPPRMLVFGAIDFAAAVARAGSFLGYHVTVCDARPVFATARRFPEADEVVVEWPHRYLAREVEAGRVDERTAMCVLTHDPKFDVPLPGGRAADAASAYIGAMGSRRTHEDRLERLREAGVPEAELARLVLADRARHRRPHAGGDGDLGGGRDRPGPLGWLGSAPRSDRRADPPRQRPGAGRAARGRCGRRGRSRVSIAGLVLAAGEGRRFGGPKALARLDGERLVDRAVRLAAAGGLDPIYVVSGAVELQVEGATVVPNPSWASGMGSSAAGRTGRRWGARQR